MTALTTTTTPVPATAEQRRRVPAPWPYGTEYAPSLRLRVVRMGTLGRRPRPPGISRQPPPTTSMRATRAAPHRPPCAPPTPPSPKVHQVVGARRSHGVCLCKDVLRRFGRQGRDRGRGQIAGIGWAHAEAAASLASNGSDTPGPSRCGNRPGHVRHAGTDQRDCRVALRRRGSGRHRRRNAAHPRLEVRSAGRRVNPLRRAGHARRDQLLPRSGRACCRAVVPPGAPGWSCQRRYAGPRPHPRHRAPPGSNPDGIAGRVAGHSFRVGSTRSLAADGASVAELQQAGGWKSPTTPGVYIRREAAARGPVAPRRYTVGT